MTRLSEPSRADTSPSSPCLSFVTSATATVRTIEEPQERSNSRQRKQAPRESTSQGSEKGSKDGDGGRERRARDSDGEDGSGREREASRGRKDGNEHREKKDDMKKKCDNKDDNRKPKDVNKSRDVLSVSDVTCTTLNSHSSGCPSSSKRSLPPQARRWDKPLPPASVPHSLTRSNVSRVSRTSRSSKQSLTSAPAKPRLSLTQCYQRHILNITNRIRRVFNAPPVSLHPVLSAIARIHNADIAFNIRYLSHVSSDGRMVGDRFLEGGYDFRYASENIARGQRNCRWVMRSWMLSPGHRRNILNPRVVHMGLHVGKGPDGKLYWCQLFGQPRKFGAQYNKGASTKN